jgi:hypothetical protein
MEGRRRSRRRRLKGRGRRGRRLGVARIFGRSLRNRNLRDV